MSTAIVEPSPEPVQIPYQRFDPTRIVGKMSVDEYLNFLEKAVDKYHYVSGEVVQMAGASPEHNLIGANALRCIGNALEALGSDCEVLGSDQRIAVNDQLYYFPDLVIVCGEWQVDNQRALLNPVGIVEILSPTTELDDRTDKFPEYQQIDSLRHYILIDQRRVAVTQYTLAGNGNLGYCRRLPRTLRDTFNRFRGEHPYSSADTDLPPCYFSFRKRWGNWSMKSSGCGTWSRTRPRSGNPSPS